MLEFVMSLILYKVVVQHVVQQIRHYFMFAYCLSTILTIQYNNVTKRTESHDRLSTSVE